MMDEVNNYMDDEVFLGAKRNKHSSKTHSKRHHHHNSRRWATRKQKKDARGFNLQLNTIYEGSREQNGDSARIIYSQYLKTMMTMFLVVFFLGLVYFLETNATNVGGSVLSGSMRYQHLQNQAIDYYQKLFKTHRESHFRTLAIRQTEDQSNWLRRKN